MSRRIPLLILGFPKIRGTILGVPIIRTIIFWGLYWGSLIEGNYHLALQRRVIHWCVHGSRHKDRDKECLEDYDV